MPEKLGIISLDLQEIHQSDSGCFIDLFPVQSYRGLKKLYRSILFRLQVHPVRSINDFAPLYSHEVLNWSSLQEHVRK